MLLFLLGSSIALAQTPAPPPVGAAALEAVYGFYSSYMDATRAGPSGERIGNYVVDRAYRSSPFLTARLIAEVDALLDNADPSEGWGDDPFLRARGIPAQIGLTVLTYTRHSAIVLVNLYFGTNPVPHALAVRLVDERGFWRIDDIRPDDVTPAGSVQTFYDAYLHQVQITPQVDMATVGCTGAGYVAALAGRVVRDPFLLGDALPRSVEVTLLQATDTEAEVLGMRQFGADRPPMPLVVSLSLGGDCPQITQVSAQVPPQMVAQAFYNRYVQAANMVRQFPAMTFETLNANDYVTPRQWEKLRRVLALNPLPVFDPVLQTDQLPVSVTAELLAQTADHASVRILGVYRVGSQTVTLPLALLEMTLQDGRWWIETITAA
jgi:hypothetical protein